MSTTGSAPSSRPADPDADRLLELGYPQELKRSLRGADNVAMGFATISPVVGLYAVAFVGMTVAGPAWVWVMPLALAGQCLLVSVYAELASQYPVANGAYQWSRRLMGPAYGWFNGWVAICAYAVANTTIAYLGAPWALAVLGVTPTPNLIVVTGIVFVLVCSLVNARGIDALRRLVNAGIAAEALASVGIGIALLLVFREHGLAVVGDTLGAEASSGGSVAGAMLAALAVAGWAFIGFDACVLTAEETHDAARHVPTALWVALLSVGALVLLNGLAVTLAHPALEDVVAGRDVDPVSTAVVGSFGDWSSKPFAAVVLVAFLACGMAAQGATARAIFSVSRDGTLPGARLLRRVDRRRAPIGALVATTSVACAGLLLGLDSAAIGSLIAFGTAAIYLAFLLVAVAALVARLRGTWTPTGPVRLGRIGLAVNVGAVLWLAFETVNIAWPRAALAPPGAPWHQIWAAPIVLVLIAVAGAAYLVVAKPHRRMAHDASVTRRPSPPAP